jgi:hypothetical protein
MYAEDMARHRYLATSAVSPGVRGPVTGWALRVSSVRGLLLFGFALLQKYVGHMHVGVCRRHVNAVFEVMWFGSMSWIFPPTAAIRLPDEQKAGEG